MNDDHDPILDACLDEVLGGQRPPDLTDRVLREWLRRQAEETPANSVRTSVSDTPLSPIRVRTGEIRPSRRLTTAPSSHSRRTVRDRRVVAWSGVALALGLVVLVAVVGQLFRGERAPIARPPSSKTIPGVVEVTADYPETANPPGAEVAVPVVSPHPSSTPANASIARMPADGSGTRGVPIGRQPSLPSLAEQSPSTVNQLVESTARPASISDDAILGRINHTIRALWSRAEVTPASPIDAAAWRQRVFRAVLGRAPSEAEIGRYSNLSSREQRATFVRELLDSQSYREEFARHWGATLTEVFLPSDLLIDDSLAVRDGMLQYFRRALFERRPFDRIVRDLITASGSGTPGASDYNGAANFLLARSEGNFERGAADTARLFLGRSVECQQCHDDHENPQRRQQEFWELNSFFRQLVLDRDPDSKTARLSDRDFLGEDGKDGDNAVVFFDQPDGVLKSAIPALRGRTEFSRSGYLSTVNRRQQLAQSITTLPDFRMAITNRLWTTLLGECLVPLNDIDATTPERRGLLRDMADQFQTRDFDFRAVIAWTVLSDPFAMPSKSPAGQPMAHGAGLFDRFAGGPIPAYRPVHEVLLASTRSFGQEPNASATTARLDSTPAPTGDRGKSVLEPVPEAELFQATAVSLDPRIRPILANSKLTVEQKASHLFQWMLHRQPRRRELDLIAQLHEKADGRTDSAWAAVWLVLKTTAADPGAVAR